jgi:hypothetical protein
MPASFASMQFESGGFCVVAVAVVRAATGRDYIEA